MVNSKTTLKEFIQSIAICNQDSDLESLVSAINNSLKMVALIDHDGLPQGIIQAHHLLGLITKRLSGNQKSHKRDQVFTKEAAEFFLKDLIVPLNSLPCQMKVQDFLVRLFLQTKNREQNYFIVDEVGKLLGILDLSRLLQVVWDNQVSAQPKVLSLPRNNYFTSLGQLAGAKELTNSGYYNQNKVSLKKSLQKTVKENSFSTKSKDVVNIQAEFRENNHSLYSLLTQISLPLMVENERGDLCYQNIYWSQKNQPDVSCFSAKSWLTSATKASLSEVEFLKRQTSQINVEQSVNQSDTSSLEIGSNNKFEACHCPTANIFSVRSFSNEKLKKQVSQLDLSVLQSTAKQKSLTEGEQVTNKSLNSSKKQLDDWYYYRLPLEIRYDFVNAKNRERITHNNVPKYWLTFATKSPLEQSLKLDNSKQQQPSNLKQLQDKFIFNFTHDIKSPLTAIIGLSTLLKDEKLGVLNQSQIRYSEMIYHNGKRLINLMNDFLDFIHLTSKDLQLKPESIDLEKTCQEIYHQVREKLKATVAIKNYNVTVFPEMQLEMASDAKIAIADNAYFSQILTRLLENALQLTSPEQLLGISTEFWSDWLAITVWNEGGGLSQTQQNLLAAGFSQSTNFLISPEKNQALGLILAQQLAQTHGGDLSFISQANYGSEFTLLLPAKSSDSLDFANTPNAKEINSLVLIVETASKRIFDLSEKLKTLGYYSIVARSQTEALYKARCFKPCKILLNSFLAASEQDLVKILAADSRTFNIPLLITTETSPQNFAGIAQNILKFPISRATLKKFFTPIVSRQSVSAQNLTVLRLSLREENTQPAENLILDLVFDNPSFSLSHHIIEADSLEQAHLLATIWDIDAIIWDGATLESFETYLEFCAELEILAAIPIITLDRKTTAAANKIPNLSVFPCLLPANERSIQKLTEVIQIAAGFG